ncbi:MAG: hypothetical protein KAJ20_00805, partial [Candidatus Aenigmarchaeota archaeon]|nr:hypothetical protein [Candidatus Aenigmarchaeota archaeon]
DKEYIVVITIGETYFNAWVNGIKTIDNISSQGGVKVSSYNYTIGKIYDTGIFNGTLDFLRMYNRELTEEEAIKITNRRG